MRTKFFIAILQSWNDLNLRQMKCKIFLVRWHRTATGYHSIEVVIIFYSSCKDLLKRCGIHYYIQNQNQPTCLLKQIRNKTNFEKIVYWMHNNILILYFPTYEPILFLKDNMYRYSACRYLCAFLPDNEVTICVQSCAFNKFLIEYKLLHTHQLRSKNVCSLSILFNETVWVTCVEVMCTLTLKN